MKVSYLSDIHADHHVPFNPNQLKWEQRTIEFTTKLIESDEGERDVLIIAGDLGHYNKQSLWILSEFSKHYNKVLYILGNHDYWLISENQSKKYNHNSINRVNELLQESVKLSPNIIPLTGDNVFTYKDVKFGGNTMWYPYETFEQKVFFDAYKYSDVTEIKGFSVENEHHVNQKEYESLLSKNIDVMVSHIPVINIVSHYKYNSTTGYLTRVKDINAKHWIMAHSHEQKVYEKPYCTFYMNAIGYPSEKLDLSIRSFII